MSVNNFFQKEKWTKYCYLIIITIFFLFEPPLRSEISTINLIIYLSFFLTATFIHLHTQNDKNWFRLDIIFLLGFGIVHFQWPIMLAFSNIEPDRLAYFFYSSTL